MLLCLTFYVIGQSKDKNTIIELGDDLGHVCFLEVQQWFDSLKFYTCIEYNEINLFLIKKNNMGLWC